ncbi:MAG: IS110 family transposase [Chloroflexota bacterium]|nr:IS110 family transposase [Chloroflexota bacterium]
MHDDAIYVGVDVSKDSLDVAAGSEGSVWRFANTPAGIRKLLRRLGSLLVALVVLEATGGYEDRLADALDEAGHALAVVNPGRIRGLARATGVLAKTDAIDARMIARYGEVVKPPARARPTGKVHALMALVGRRDQLLTMQAAERSRLEVVSDSTVRGDIRRAIDGLGRRIKALEDRIAAVIAADRELKARNDLLTSVPGVGPTLASTLAACLPELGSLDNKAIAALAGVAPFSRDSGRTSGKRFIWGGRSQVRKVLYMGALVAAKHNPVIREFYQRLVESGKPKKLALTACMRKLLVILNSMLRHGEYWRAPAATAPLEDGANTV